MVKLAMTNTVRVRDVMSTDVFALDVSETIEVAATHLTERHVSGAPVLSGRHIVGIVSKSDLVDPRRIAANGHTVEGLMTRVVYAVRPADPLMTAVRLMVQENIHRVVVVSESGRLSGILSSMDVMAALARGDHVQEQFIDSGGMERHADPAGALDFVDLRSFTLEG